VLPAKFVSLSDPVYNAARDVAFIGRLNIGATGIWWKNGDTLKLVALRDEHPPGTPAGARWLTFPSVALPDGTGAAPAFVARMQSGLGRVNVLNRVGLWAIDRAGVIRLVARTGDSVLVHGTPPAKKIASLSFLPLVLGSPDHPRSYNDAAQFTYKATFTDNTQAVFRVDLP
jgi:hypothetical protein